MQQEQGEIFIRKSLVFQFPPPLGLGALQRTQLCTAYYRSKQLAFAELQHLTLEPLLFATLYKYLWKLDKAIFWQFYSNLRFCSGESLSLLAGLQDPQSDIWDDRDGSGFPSDCHSCYLTFYARQKIENELRFWRLERNMYLELTLMLFQSFWCADLWRVSKCLFLLISSTAQWDRTFINKAMQRATSFFERTTIELQQFSIQHTSSFGFAMFYERVCFTTVEFFVQLISRYHK